MKRIAWGLAVVIVALAAGCGGPPHVPLEGPSFRTPAPRMVAFDVMYRRAAVLGYVYAAVDAERTTFSVHSRLMGRPPRGRGMDPNAARRSNLFVVSVNESHVEITAVGRNVDSSGTLDPTLAQELEIFGEAMHRAIQAVGGGLLSGDGYGGTPLPREPRRDETPRDETPPDETLIAADPPPADEAGAGTGLTAP